VSVTCDLAKLYPPEVLQAGDYTLEVNYANFFQPQGIQLFQGSISAAPIPVPVAEPITTHIITIEAGAGGSILLSGSAVSGPVVVRRGSSQTFTIAPNSGYRIADVKVDGVSQGAISSYTFSGVDKDHTISATFAISTYTITATAGAHGSITPSGTVTVNYLANKTFTIKPNTSYHVADVLVDGVSVGAVTTYTFRSVTDNHTISATFAINTYVLTVTKAGTGSGTVTASRGPLVWNGNVGTATYDAGTTVTLTATANTGSTFTSWVASCSGSGNCSVVISGSKCTVNMCGPCNAKATFKKK
jgi:hypothetical protein